MRNDNKNFDLFVAGMGAGLGTEFAGMSAAAVISPMLITFLDEKFFEKTGPIKKNKSGE